MAEPSLYTVGDEGELVALRYLKLNGYEILSRNYRKKRGELDVVCHKDGVIVFIEVKTRREQQFGHPFESITTRKKQQLIKMAKQYLVEHNLWDKTYVRFDVIGVSWPKDGNPSIEHIVDAFRVGG